VRSLVVAIACVSLGACATTNPTSDKVTLASDRTQVASCEPLGQMQSQSFWGGTAATGIAYNDALASLKNQASEKGGTHILLINSSNTVGGTNMIGDAFRCKA
jgi:uncharacterized protein DUF4156